MHKIYILLITTLLTNIAYSKASVAIDSIGVENHKGKKVIIYQVEPKETYYSIAKKYNVVYQELMEFNDSKLLQIGGILKVPTSTPFSNSSPSAPSQPSKSVALNTTEYTVKAKDNLNLIAKNHGVTVDQIKEANQLSSINLQIGQVLRIPSQNTITNPVSSPAENTPSSTYKKPTGKESNTTASNNSSPQTTNLELNTPIPAPTVSKPVKVTSTKIINHKIKSGDNLSTLAEKYDTSVDAIKKLNKLSSTSLRAGQSLKISTKVTTTKYVTVPAPQNNPRVNSALENEVANTPTNTNRTTTTPAPQKSNFEHIVEPGETIYSIAKRYNLTTYQLRTANNLSEKENDLAVGKKLKIVGGMKSIETIENEEEQEDSGINSIKDPKLRQAASKYGLVSFNEKGTAVWIEDADLDATKMLVLHRTAPVGTIIRITNPMTNRSAFAKVVGKFTENETTKDVIVVLTKAVADAVGALDKRFFCNLNYGAVDNEQK